MSKEEAEKRLEEISKHKIATHIELRRRFKMTHEIIQEKPKDLNSFTVKTTFLDEKTNEPYISKSLIDRFFFD